ncbi:hypothetical protein PFICI_05541 [Pestalotiopsis fici W106-1]|uniref:Uncharacterized protein n=1 Tax=Pestalotiopsis fici (strain W106-1 / CGMCC3.15140) TaxID=1229662 RepID=W3XC88_PESFW|nr:uncharacterized protein PFICI_05541 [Pestalotiopsis fici W106-1]ETS83665.1 hypothetical protein PFICI_05541 [Pestalotiopsis fici W106-1]
MITPADVSATSSLDRETISGSSDRVGASPMQNDQSTSIADSHGVTNAYSPEDRQVSPVQNSAQDPAQDVATGSATINSSAFSLHQAIKNHDMESLNRLLNQGVDVNSTNGDYERPLYYACEVGLQEAVEPLLEAGADAEARSINYVSSPHPTALFLTVEKSWIQLTELLLKSGADINATNLKHSTVLSMAIHKRDVNMIRLLLRYGADKNLQNLDGETSIDLARGSQDISSLFERSQGPPTTTAELQEACRVPIHRVRPPTYNRDKMIACHNFQAALVEFHVDKFEERKTEIMSVYELLYGHKPSAKPSEEGTNHRVFRWYHLPANNMEWVEATGLGGTTGVRIESLQISLTGDEKVSKQIVAFAPYLHFEDQPKFAARTDELRGILSSLAEVKTRMVHPSRRRDYNSSRPYERLDPDDPSNWRAAESLHIHLLKGYLTPEMKNDVPRLHIRRTLDQYLYTHLDTQERDKDQVVSRWMARSNNPSISKVPKMFMVDQLWLWIINEEDTVITCASEDMNSLSAPLAPIEPARSPLVNNERNHASESLQRAQETAVPSILTMIRNRTRDQRGRELTRTAPEFLPASPGPSINHLSSVEDVSGPRAEVKNSESPVITGHTPLDVRQKILRYLEKVDRAPIETPYQLASIITRLSMSVFDHHEVPAEFQFFDFFEQSIGVVVTHLLRLFKDRATNDKGDNLQGHIDIQEEANLLVEIEDIHDELMILEKILEDQKSFMQDFGMTLTDATTSDDGNDHISNSLPVEDHFIIENHVQRVDSMLKSTEKTKNTASRLLLSLLDLKQKQASIFQAMASVEYSRQQANQARETAIQGRTLMLFTVVTILFLPLSFMSAFFAIEIDVFPVNDNGKLQLDYILKYMGKWWSVTPLCCHN